MAEEETIIELVEEPVAEHAWQEGASALRVVRLQEFESPYTLSVREREPYLRRMTTLFIDDARTRKGSTGKVLHATNAFGERFALKVYDGSLDREYEMHRKVSDIKGYPTLYGKSLLGDRPALLMEWVEGEDLARFASRMAIDDEGRLSPLMAARLGRDLFDVLARTSVLEGDLIHGDLSFRNILVCTTLQPIEDQAAQGAFDLRLIDLGSARFASDSANRCTGESDSPFAVIFPATPQFAAPELRHEGNGGGHDRSCTAAVDVYATSRILSFLLCGDGSSSTTVHATEADITATLLREPEVAVAVDRVAAGLTPAPSAQEVKDALAQVDDALVELLRCGLDLDPTKRPTAKQMRNALDSFCASYVDNLGHALRGEELDHYDAPFIYKDLDRLSLHARNAIRTVGKSLSLGLLAAMVAITAVVVGMNEIAFNWGDVTLEGVQVELLVVGLLLPLVCGLVARGRRRNDRVGFLRGSAGVVIGAACASIPVVAGSFDPPAFEQLFLSAVFAAAAMAWCPLVFDIAFPSASARVRRSYRALPEHEADDPNETTETTEDKEGYRD